MITLDSSCGMSFELLALLEVAAKEADYSSPESFMIDVAVKEAGKVLAHTGDKRTGTEEDQLDLFGEDE